VLTKHMYRLTNMVFPLYDPFKNNVCGRYKKPPNYLHIHEQLFKDMLRFRDQMTVLYVHGIWQTENHLKKTNNNNYIT